MQIKLNGQTVDVFSGARVEDALRRYSRAEWRRVRNGEKKVCDRHGNEVSLGGELSGGEELVTVAAAPAEPGS